MSEELQCPWGIPASGGFPLCEERICAWIQQPANAYTNIGFILVGIYLIYLYFKQKSPAGLGFGICTIFIGLASFGAHSSGLKFLGFLDFAAIFSIFCFYLVQNLTYVKPHLKKHTFSIFIPFYLICSILLYYFTPLRNPLFAAAIIGIIWSEYKILKAENKKIWTGPLRTALIFFALSATCLFLDMNKIACDPQNHFFQFHMMWHLFNAISLYFLTRHVDLHRYNKAI